MIVDLNDGLSPTVSRTAWIAPNAVVVGAVTIEDKVSVWYSAVLRADTETVSVGSGSNVQDGCVIHADPGFPAAIGSGVSIGHNATLHGCTIDDNVLVGMGATIMNGARIGEDCIVAAGALITEGMAVPPRSLVAGLPAKVRRELTDEEVAKVRANAAGYEARMTLHADAR